MRNKNIIAALLLLLSLPLRSVAQEEWDLKKCISFALSNNFDCKTFELKHESADVQAKQAIYNFTPSLSASSSAGLSYGRQVDSYSNKVVDNTRVFSNNIGIGANIELFRGFYKINQVAISKLRYQAAQWRKIDAQDNLAFTVLASYYDLLFFKGLIDIANEQMELSAFNLKKTEIQISTGQKAKTDLAEMKAIYEKEKFALLQAQNELEQGYLILAQKMNLPARQLIKITNTPNDISVNEANLLLSEDSLFLSFIAFSPIVKLAEVNKNVAYKQIATSRAGYYPRISLSASVNAGYYDSNRDSNNDIIAYTKQINNNLYKRIGASITIPIYSKNQVRSSVKQAKIARAEAEINMENSKQEAYYQLLNNSRELKALYSEYSQIQKQLEADELAYYVAKRKYEEGFIGVIELLAVKNRLAESKSQLLFSKLQWEIKNNVMQFYKGIRFWTQ